MCSNVNFTNLAYMFTWCYLLKGGKKSFVIPLDIFYNMHMHMVNLKELAFVNETIRCLWYKTLK